MTELQNALACAQRVFDLIDETPIVPDGPDAVALPHGAGSVEFDHVRFRYLDDVPLIEDMNLRLRRVSALHWSDPRAAARRHWSIY